MEPKLNFLSAREAAKILGISRNGVLHALQRGTIDAHKVEGAWRVSEESVLKYQAAKYSRGRPRKWQEGPDGPGT